MPREAVAYGLADQVITSRREPAPAELASAS